jgi:16S rRNA (guanine527-N7)-methyltransferase
MLGNRPVAEVIEHARAFVAALTTVVGTVVDLGAGGGVPGLVIAIDRPDLRLVLVDRRATRTDHLRRLVRRLGIEDRVDVMTADVTTVAVAADAAVARSFGPPATTLTAARGVVRPGGVIIVSEPPVVTPSRWPADVLATLGLTAELAPDRRVAVFRCST